MSPLTLREQFAKRGNIIIALDQDRPRSDAGNHGLIQAPDRIRDRRTMRVDQQLVAELGIGFMAGEVDFTNRLGWKPRL